MENTQGIDGRHEWDAVVIGGGAAGSRAALMLVRARRSVLMVDAGQPRNAVAAHMHGVLGHDGKPPRQLVAEGRREIEGYGGVVGDGRVDGARRSTTRTGRASASPSTAAPRSRPVA